MANLPCMLSQLSRTDWSQMMGLPSDWSPEVVWLRGTRNLTTQAEEHRKFFEQTLPCTVPNGLFEDLLVGQLQGARVLYASVYGAAMATEVVHLGATLGARLVLLTGCCGSLSEELNVGELLVANQANRPGTPPIKARIYGRDLGPLPGGRLRFGPVTSCEGLFSYDRTALEQWQAQGQLGVDLETGPVYAAADRFNLDRVSILYAFDQPLGGPGLTHEDAALRTARLHGNVTMNALALQILKDYTRVRSA